MPRVMHYSTHRHVYLLPSGPYKLQEQDLKEENFSKIYFHCALKTKGMKCCPTRTGSNRSYKFIACNENRDSEYQ